MGSLDVDSLFTNIPLDEAINICTNTAYSEQDVIEDINKEEFRNLLSLPTKKSDFIFNEVLYKQEDRVVMGSPLGPTLANVFLCFYVRKWLQKCPLEFEPVFYRRYVDNIFVSSKSTNYFERFCN